MDGFKATTVRLAAAATLCVAVALASLVTSPGNAATIDPSGSLATERNATVDQTTQSLEERFAGAPDGVDPVVTGPVSAAFKQRRVLLRCEEAVWPNVSPACYPD